MTAGSHPFRGQQNKFVIHRSSEEHSSTLHLSIRHKRAVCGTNSHLKRRLLYKTGVSTLTWRNYQSPAQKTAKEKRHIHSDRLTHTWRTAVYFVSMPPKQKNNVAETIICLKEHVKLAWQSNLVLFRKGYTAIWWLEIFWYRNELGVGCHDWGGLRCPYNDQQESYFTSSVYQLEWQTKMWNVFHVTRSINLRL